MINVPQITADLARMPDRSLQQYAQMHRNDPYIVALALAESNRRKQLRTGAQAGQAQQMPTVVEQDLAQMAPEQVGIGSLPEQSLAKMAGGGIVAFEEGGEVEHYAAGDLVGDKGFIDFLQKNGKTVRDFVNALPSEQAAIKAAYTGVQGPAVPAATVTPTAAPTTAGVSPGLSSLFKSGLGAVSRSPLLGLATQLFGTSDEELAVLRAADTKRADEAQQKYDQDVAAGRLPAGPISKSTFSTDVSQGRLRDIAFDKDKTPVPLPKDYAEKTAAPAVPAAPPMTMQDILKQAQGLVGGGGGPSGGISLLTDPAAIKAQMAALRPNPANVTVPYAKEREELGKQEIAAAQEQQKLFEEDVAKQGLFGAEQEKRLKAREEKLGKQAGENTGLALLKAGFAMMGGASPHAFVNIGAGAGIGVDEYTKGKDKIDAAQEKLDDAFAKLDEVRRGERVANARELRALKKDVTNAQINVKKTSIDALDKYLGIEESVGQKLFEASQQNRRSVYEQQEATKRAGAQNAAHLAGLMFQAAQEPQEVKTMRAYQADPDLAKLREKFLTAAAGLRGEDALLAQYAKNPVMLMMLEKTDPVEAARIRQLLSQRMGGGIMAPTTSGASGASNQWGPASVVKP